MIALVAIELGASVGAAGLIVGLFGVGALVSEVPAGLLISRVGDRRVMAASTSLLGLAGLAVAARPGLVTFGVLVTLMGAATAVFGLGRLVAATEMTEPARRGRVMATIGGIHRIGLVIGPILGGFAIAPVGLTGPFLVGGVLALSAAFLVLVRASSGPSYAAQVEKPPGVLTTVRAHKSTFSTATLAVVAFSIVRSSRQVVIPLWGAHLGLDPRQIGFLFSISAGMEVLMFYPIGRLMDRRGRKSAAIPSLATLSLGVAAIPFTTSVISLGVVVAIVGFANGMSTGINMTLSSDLSPAVGRSVFLGVWRTITDAGTAGGPSLVALVASLANLGVAAAVVAAFGLSGAAVLWLVVPETLSRSEH